MEYGYKDYEKDLLEKRRYLYYSTGLLEGCIPKPQDVYVWNETLQKYENKDLY